MPIWNQFPPGNPETLLFGYTYWGNLNESNVTSTGYRLDFYNNPSSYIIVEGSGFQFYYDDNEEHLYNVGSVSSFTLFTSTGYPVAQVTDLNLLPFDLLGTLLSTSAATLRSSIEGQAWTFNGSAGDDTITAGNQADTVVAHSGNDKVYGLQGADSLEGGSGNDTLDGGLNADTMNGGAGNDSFIVDNLLDVIRDATGGGASDVVTTSVTYTLTAGAEIERLETSNAGGTGPINLTGNEFAQRIVGNDGVNRLDGKGGADTLEGRNGNDVYIVDNGNDVVVEGAGGGTADAVYAVNVGYSLGASAQVELLATSDASQTVALNLYGNSFNQTVMGNNGANQLSGGLGTDTLRGFGGQDHFLFNTALGPTNVDTIFDFVAVDDTIRLDDAIFVGLVTGNLSGSIFKDTASGTVDADDRIIYSSATGDLYFDRDGLGNTYETIKFATITGHPTISAADFLVV